MPLKPFRGAKVNLSHRLASGLVGCWVFNERTGSRINNLANSSAITANTDYTWVGNLGDSVLTLGTSTSSGRVNLGDIDISGDMTVITVVTPLRKAINTEVAALSKWNSGGSAGTNEWLLGLNYYSTASDYYPYFAIEIGSTTYKIQHTPTWNTGVPLFIAGVREYTTVKLYRNGVNVGSTACGSGSINNASGRSILLGEIAVGFTYNTNAAYSYVYLYNRALSDGEIAHVYGNPYDIFSSHNKQYVVAFGASTSLSIDSCTHTHSCDSPTVHGVNLAINSSSHSHTCDSPVVNRCIQINDCSHTQSCDNVTITTPPKVTWNPNDKYSTILLYNQNLTAERNSGTSSYGLRNTNSKTFGKWYVEVTVEEATYPGNFLGVATIDASLTEACGLNNYGWGFQASGGSVWHDSTSYSYGNTWLTDGTVIGIALDCDNGKLWFSIDGVWQNSGDPEAGTGAAFTDVSGALFLYGTLYRGTAPKTRMTANFGHSDYGDPGFVYNIPSGFTAWETDNTLSINNCIHSHSCTSPSTVTIASTNHNLTSTTPDLGQIHSCTHNHTCDSCNIVRTLTVGLDVEYLMESISGSTVTDTSGNNRTGTLQGNAVQSDEGAYGVGKSVNFPNTSYNSADRVDFVSDPITHIDWTVSAYMLVDSPGGSSFLTGQYNYPGWIAYDNYADWTQIVIYPGTGNFAKVVFTWTVRDDANNPVQLPYQATANAGTVGEWFHVAVRRVITDSGYPCTGTLEFFCNGEKVGSTVNTSTDIHGLPIDHKELWGYFDTVGACRPVWWEDYYDTNVDGKVDNFRIYNRALTDVEILFLSKENVNFYIYNSIHEHTADSPAVVGSNLSIDNCTHSHNVVVVSVHSNVVVLSDCIHTHTIDQPLVTVIRTVFSDSTVHSLTSDEIDIGNIQVHINSCVHGQYATVIEIEVVVVTGSVDIKADVVGYCGSNGEVSIYDFVVNGSGMYNYQAIGNINCLLSMQARGIPGYVGAVDIDIQTELLVTCLKSISADGDVEVELLVSSTGYGSGVFDDYVLRYIR